MTRPYKPVLRYDTYRSITRVTRRPGIEAATTLVLDSEALPISVCVDIRTEKPFCLTAAQGLAALVTTALKGGYQPSDIAEVILPGEIERMKIPEDPILDDIALLLGSVARVPEDKVFPVAAGAPTTVSKPYTIEGCAGILHLAYDRGLLQSITVTENGWMGNAQGSLHASLKLLAAMLRAGTPPEQAVAAWTGFPGSPAGLTGDKKVPLVTSFQDYVARVLTTEQETSFALASEGAYAYAADDKGGTW